MLYLYTIGAATFVVSIVGQHKGVFIVHKEAELTGKLFWHVAGTKTYVDFNKEADVERYLEMNHKEYLWAWANELEPFENTEE